MNTQVVTSEGAVVNPVTGSKAKTAKAKPAPKKVGKAAAKSAKPAKAEKPAASDGSIALKTICSQVKVEPTLARRKLRSAKLDFHGHRERWTFTAKQAVKVREILA